MSAVPSRMPRFPVTPALGIARAGWPIIIVFAIVCAGVGSAAVWIVGPAGWAVAVVCAVLTLWCVWFFRDPERRAPEGEWRVVSPADGVVCKVGPAAPPAELGLSEEQARGMRVVCVFMNVFNVHVNRAPMQGRVERVHYRPGKFFNASFDKASEHNERSSMVMRLADGRALVVVQIAGLVARRIVCAVREGVSLGRGERYGLIRFGSRVDVYLPADAAIRVKVGDRAVAGETVIAELQQGAMVGAKLDAGGERSRGAAADVVGGAGER